MHERHGHRLADHPAKGVVVEVVEADRAEELGEGEGGGERGLPGSFGEAANAMPVEETAVLINLVEVQEEVDLARCRSQP